MTAHFTSCNYPIKNYRASYGGLTLVYAAVSSEIARFTFWCAPSALYIISPYTSRTSDRRFGTLAMNKQHTHNLKHLKPTKTHTHT